MEGDEPMTGARRVDGDVSTVVARRVEGDEPMTGARRVDGDVSTAVEWRVDGDEPMAGARRVDGDVSTAVAWRVEGDALELTPVLSFRLDCKSTSDSFNPALLVGLELGVGCSTGRLDIPELSIPTIVPL